MKIIKSGDDIFVLTPEKDSKNYSGIGMATRLTHKQAKKLKKQLKKALKKPKSMEIIENWPEWKRSLVEVKDDFKPDWGDAPDWAKWCACDKNGDLYFYKTRPKVYLGEECYSSTCENISVRFHKNIGYQKNWKKMIWRRPE